MNVLGIDHPLVCVRDLPKALELYRRLGFRIKGIGQHPWGTSTCAALFKESLLELMSIYDTSLIDKLPAGSFRFGRFINESLQEREGIALTALYTADAERDAEIVMTRGVECQGTIEFGRDVVLADGRPDRTKTTLKIFESKDLPRLSNFACQQHKRDLIEFPEWMNHPNTAFGFESVSILADKSQHTEILEWLGKIHGRQGISFISPGVTHVRTGNGYFLILDSASASQRYGSLPSSISEIKEPFEFAIDVKVRSLKSLTSTLSDAGVKSEAVGERVVISDADLLGGILLSFVEAIEGA